MPAPIPPTPRSPARSVPCTSPDPLSAAIHFASTIDSMAGAAHHPSRRLIRSNMPPTVEALTAFGAPQRFYCPLQGQLLHGPGATGSGRRTESWYSDAAGSLGASRDRNVVVFRIYVAAWCKQRSAHTVTSFLSVPRRPIMLLYNQCCCCQQGSFVKFEPAQSNRCRWSRRNNGSKVASLHCCRNLLSPRHKC